MKLLFRAGATDGAGGGGGGGGWQVAELAGNFPARVCEGKNFPTMWKPFAAPVPPPSFFSNRDFIIEFHGERLASGGGRAGGDVENKRNCTRFRPLHAMTRRPLCPGKFCNKCSRNNLPSGSSPGPYLVSLRFPPPPLPPAIIDNALL